MKSFSFKKIHLFFSSFFIFFLHLPFVFAKTKPKMDNVTGFAGLQPLVVSDSTSALQLLIQNNIQPSIYDSLRLASYGLARQAFDYAMKGFNSLKETGGLVNQNIISIVDFSKPSSQKRLFVIDLKNYKVLFNTYVAHGVNSGKEFANQFSNRPESNKSSLGFYETADTYFGKHGYSLHLQGIEKGVNDNAYKRDIVIHGAEYVNENMIKENGYIGRSWGCPALPQQLSKSIIDKIKDGTCFFIFGEDKKYLSHSVLLKNTSPVFAYNS